VVELEQKQLKLKDRKWFKGYIVSQRVEIAITATFAALAAIFRQFPIPLFPPLIVLDLAGAFAYIPASLVGFPYVFVFVIVNTMTAPNPFFAATAWIISIPLVNLLSKPSMKYAKLAPLAGPYTGIATFVVILDVLGVLPPAISIPTLLVRATANMAVIFLLSPIIWKVFETMNLLKRSSPRES
jgi:hypothetical protein